MHWRGLAKWVLGALVVLSGAGYAGFIPVPWAAPDKSATAPKKGDAKRGGGAAPVKAAKAVEADMPIIIAAPGTVEPLANVAVKTRVDGQVMEVRFAEGDQVKPGDVLFKLDDRLVVAQIAQAEAQIAKDEASLRDAEATLARRESLIANRVVTEAALDQARYAVEGFKASIKAGRALLESQRTQLDYLTIRAPIGGRTGALNAKVGATVRGIDTVPLVTINQTKPITVTFSVPQAELPALKRALEAKAGAEIRVPGLATPVAARIAFIDNQVDKTTGTVIVKVISENTDEVLWPGLAVEVALTVEVRPSVVSVPAAAVLPAQQGMIVWVVGPDKKVATRVVTVAAIVRQTAYLAEGLKPGETVVTDGQIRLAQGATVSFNEPDRREPATGARDNGKG